MHFGWDGDKNTHINYRWATCCRVRVCVCECSTYKQNGDILQHVRVVQAVCSVLPVTQHADTRLLVVQGQIHVVPTDTHKQFTQSTTR